MELSDEERRRLEMLEQELAKNDPDFVRKLESGTTGGPRREAAGIVRGVLTILAALTLVIAGIATELIIIGTLGFLLMIAGANILLKGLHGQRGTKERP